MTRREAVKLIAKSVALVAVPATSRIAFSAPRPSASLLKSQSLSRFRSGALHVINTHTSEELDIRYLDDKGRLDPVALERLNRLFRCHYNDEIRRITPDLYILLDMVHTRMKAGGRPFELISGYRSPEYNRLLRRKGRGVAKRSYHLRGMAADVRVEGKCVSDLRSTALRLQKGGVGSYREFIHIDIGPVRSW